MLASASGMHSINLFLKAPSAHTIFILTKFLFVCGILKFPRESQYQLTLSYKTKGQNQLHISTHNTMLTLHYNYTTLTYKANNQSPMLHSDIPILSHHNSLNLPWPKPASDTTWNALAPDPRPTYAVAGGRPAVPLKGLPPITRSLFPWLP